MLAWRMLPPPPATEPRGRGLTAAGVGGLPGRWFLLVPRAGHVCRGTLSSRRCWGLPRGAEKHVDSLGLCPLSFVQRAPTDSHLVLGPGPWGWALRDRRHGGHWQGVQTGQTRCRAPGTGSQMRPPSWGWGSGVHSWDGSWNQVSK